MDCGPTCLRMIARHYGRSYSLQNLRERCHITREGVSMLGISDAAEDIGFRSTGVKITWEQLRDEMPLPCIVHWNQRHFVVVYEIRKRRGGYIVKVADPASGLLTYTEEAFCRAWLQTGKDNEIEDEASVNTHGIALMLEPTPKFYEEKGDDEKKLGFGYILGYLRNSRLITNSLFILNPLLTLIQ